MMGNTKIRLHLTKNGLEFSRGYVFKLNFNYRSALEFTRCSHLCLLTLCLLLLTMTSKSVMGFILQRIE